MIEAHDCLAVLIDAVGQRTLGPHGRILATADPRSPDEGLALLGSYVAIADRRVRQAVLDALQMIASADEVAKTPA